MKRITITLTPAFFVLFFILLVLKFLGCISVSWAVVTAPLWFPIAFAVAISILIVLFILILFLIALLKHIINE